MWQETATDDELLVQLLVDSSKLAFYGDRRCDWDEVECFTRYYCAALFHTRATSRVSHVSKVRSKRVAELSKKTQLQHKSNSYGTT